jgi:excinuclease ABC subunit A
VSRSGTDHGRIYGTAHQFAGSVIRSRKGHYRGSFLSKSFKQGFVKVRVVGVIVSKEMKLDRYKIHDIEMVIDRAEVGTSRE